MHRSQFRFIETYCSIVLSEITGFSFIIFSLFPYHIAVPYSCTHIIAYLARFVMKWGIFQQYGKNDICAEGREYKGEIGRKLQKGGIAAPSVAVCENSERVWQLQDTISQKKLLINIISARISTKIVET